MTEIKLNLENLTEDERKTLMALVEKGNNTSKVWKPKDGEQYWYIYPSGDAESTAFEHGCRTDQFCFDIGNCFRTQEEAEEAVERLKVLTKWKRLSVEAGEDENPWDDDHYHWRVFAPNYSNSLEYYPYNDFRCGIVTFPSEETIEAAIEEIGEDNVKKYILGIKE